jgi:DHA2 family multidrug resistance protein
MPISSHLREGSGFLPRFNHESSFYPWFVLVNIMVGTFMAVLDSTIVNVGITKIMNSFGTSVDKVEWIMTAYMLAMAVMLPASGWIADHFGYKRSYFTGMFLFTLGSLLCGMAWNETVLIGFRVIQGLGAGLLMPVGLAILTRTFPAEKRGMVLGLWGIASAASVSFGPVIGGYLIDNLSWHAIFLVNIPVGIMGLAATIIIQKEYKTEHTRSFDFAGAASMTVFLTFLLLALACGNSSWNTDGWHSQFIITCFVIAAIAFVLFLYIDLTVENPIIELKIFKDFNFSMGNIVFFIFSFGMFGSTFLLPLYLQSSLGYTALQAGMFFLPVGIIQAFLSPVTGIMSDRINPKIPAFIGLAVLGIGLILQMFLSLDSSNLQIMLPMLLRGVGMGMIFSPLSAVSLSRIPPQKLAQASGLFNILRQVGGSFGVAVMGAILSHQAVIHSANYIQAINRNSPAFQSSLSTIRSTVEHGSGKNRGDASAISQMEIFQNASSQAFVQAICDDFLIAGSATLVCLFPLLMLRYTKRPRAPGQGAGAQSQIHD